MKKYLLLASTLFCLFGALPVAHAVDLPSDAIRKYAKNPNVDVMLKISYESEDQANIDAFRKAADDLGLHYQMTFTVSAASDKATTKKWKLQTSNKVTAQADKADKQVSALYETVKSKGGSFSWEIAQTPK